MEKAKLRHERGGSNAKMLYSFQRLFKCAGLRGRSRRVFRAVFSARSWATNLQIETESIDDLLRQSPEPAPDSDPGARVISLAFKPEI